MAIISAIRELVSAQNAVLYCLIPSVILYLVNALFLTPPLPKGIALIREPPGKTSFSLKTRWAYLTNCEAIFREAYQNYAKKGHAVLIPGFGIRTELILPTKSLRWALSQPDHILSTWDAFAEIDQTHYSLGDEKYVSDPWQGNLVKKELNAILDTVVSALGQELSVAFDEYFGTDEENWSEIELEKAVGMVVAQAASRFSVGLPLCRNKVYLHATLSAINGLVLNAGITGGTPAILRPLIGRLAGLQCHIAQERVKKHFKPLYESRLQTLRYPPDDRNHTEPQDHLQLMLRFAQRERPDEVYDFDTMSRRLTAINFGSMHQTSIQVTNMLLNILGSDGEFDTVRVLREEIADVLEPADEVDAKNWTKANIAKMIKADSVARETLRCHSFSGRAVFRKVMVDGVVTDTGVSLPKGTIISFLGQPAHLDEAVYADPTKYDPFRFSRAREAASLPAADENNNSNTNNKTSFVSTGPDFLPFGHGKHACPGRFLIDFELKMIIAYVLTNYEMRFPEGYGGERPPNRWLAEALFPPAGVKVLVKRRREGKE
ncbi:cytochrome P450 [Aspergillus heterothallicus]